MAPAELSQLVKQCAVEAGFDQVGIGAAGPHPHGGYLRQWLREGKAGRMGYLHRHVPSRIDVRAWLPNVTHVIVVTLNYRQPDVKQPEGQTRSTPVTPASPENSRTGDSAAPGRIAMYAWGEDYHGIIRDKLNATIASMRSRIAAPFLAWTCVDTSAITERELAAAAGIGWIGKNTLVLNKTAGSYFFLGVILTDLPLLPDPPITDHCGSCTRCLDACPTDAFPAPYTMDARRCISYLTIEHRVDIEPALAAKMDDWLFGCDVCQTVCPFNRKAPETAEPRLRVAPANATPVHQTEDSPALIVRKWPDAEEVAQWTDADWEGFTDGKALARATPDMWRRNALIALANAATPKDGSARPIED